MGRLPGGILSSWAGPAAGARSLADLVGSEDTVRDAAGPLSPPYLRACQRTISARAAAVARTSNSALSPPVPEETPNSTSSSCLSTRDFRPLSGGTRQALNVRAAQYLLAAGIETHDGMHDVLAELLADQPELARYERQSVTDAEVRAYIRQGLRDDGEATHTRLLRDFRDSNHACEQGRFAALFRSEKRERP